MFIGLFLLNFCIYKFFNNGESMLEINLYQFNANTIVNVYFIYLLNNSW